MAHKLDSNPSVEEKGIPVENSARQSPDRHQLSSYRLTLLLAAASLGVVYGDLGTSPIYTVGAIFPAAGEVPEPEDVVGAISAIIWTLILVAFVKYGLIALNFGVGPNGSREGGPMALYISLYPSPTDSDNRTLTSFPTFSSKLHSPSAPFFESKWVKRLLFGWAAVGVSFTLSDGMLTPAVSVVSAVAGIAAAFPGVEHATVPISVAILVVLFALQFLGTQRVGLMFSPILAIFLVIIGISGVINIVSNPAILRAFDPSRLVMWFVRTRDFDKLAGVLLSVTGCEAMFANLGQFSKASIRIGFLGCVFPCVIASYLGQGARLMSGGAEILSNPYYASVPGGIGSPFYWVTFVFTILAAIIASQAMISATFSLVQQLVTFHAMPALRVIHTSSLLEGQVFVPVINVVLLLGTIGFVVGFGTGAGLTNAFGFAVSTVFIVTTTFIAISIVRVKHLSIFTALAFLLVFGFIDALFWGASLKKIPEGAYAPLAVGVVTTLFLLFWSWAKGLEDTFDARNRKRIGDAVRGVAEEDSERSGLLAGEALENNDRIRIQLPPSRLPHHEGQLQLVGRDFPLYRLPIFAFFHNQSGNTMDGTPHSFAAFLRCYPSLPQVIVFLSIMTVERAYTTEEERYVVSRVRAFDGVYTAKIFLGYRDVVDLTNIAQPIFEAIKSLERSSDDSQAEERISSIQDAMKQSVTHILPHFYVSSKSMSNKVVNYGRRFLIEGIYRRLQGDDAAGYVMKEESVLRMGIAADL